MGYSPWYHKELDATKHTHTLLSTLAPKGPRQHCPHCLHHSFRPPAEGSWQLTTAALTPCIFYSSSPRYSLTPTHNIVYTGCPGELPTLSPLPPPCSLHSPLLQAVCTGSSRDWVLPSLSGLTTPCLTVAALSTPNPLNWI